MTQNKWLKNVLARFESHGNDGNHKIRLENRRSDLYGFSFQPVRFFHSRESQENWQSHKKHRCALSRLTAHKVRHFIMSCTYRGRL